MPTIQVLLSSVTGTIRGSQAKEVVGLTVDLNLLGKATTAKGAGVTLATEAFQPAELLFFEVPVGRDAVKEPKQFAKLEGKLRLEGGKPVLQGSPGDARFITYAADVRSGIVGSSPNLFPPETSTDYHLKVDFVQTAFRNVDHVSGFNRRLFLPWRDVVEEDSTLDIACELKIAGEVEFRFDAKNVVSVPMRHPGVPLDGVCDPGKRRTPSPAEHHGVGVVHPARNWLLAEKGLQPKAITFPSPPRIEVHLHTSVGAVMRSPDRVAQAIRDCFDGTGITVDVRPGRSDQDAEAAGFVRKKDASAGQDVTFQAKDPGGASLPFFTYWVTFEQEVDQGVSGLSESILKVTPGASPTKLLRYPIRLIGGRDGQTNNARGIKRDLESLQDDENKDRHVGNVIAHEVGHSFGFDHTLHANPDTGYSLQLGDNDIMRCVMCWENLGAFKFTRKLRFGPVFLAMLRRDFGLP